MRIVCSLLSILLLTVTTWATPVQAEDDGFASYREEFGRLYRGLQAGNGMLSGDRQTIESFLDRIESFRTANPDHLAATATALQLNLWLKNTDRTSELFGELMDLRPEDVSIATSWIAYLESTGDLSDSDLDGVYQDLARRFQGNADFALRVARRHRDRAEYTDAIELLQAVDLDPTKDADAEATLILAECLFADHQFAEAKAAADSIPSATATRNPVLLRNLDSQRKDFDAYPELWTKEQEIRSAEAAAGDLPIAEIQTSKGRIVVELFENEAPNTVANFITLAERSFYDGTKFHRYVPNFMVQGGDVNSKDDVEGRPGEGDPGYVIPDEHTLDNHRMHFSDSIAMAKKTAPDTAGSQFYLNHKPTPWLNGKHTVFGRVIEGRNVVSALRQDDAIVTVIVTRKRDRDYAGELKTLPVTSAPVTPPVFDPSRISDDG